LGEATRRLETGDGFFEPARRAILKFDNASDSEPAEIVCFYLADTPIDQRSRCSKAAWPANWVSTDANDLRD